MAPASESFGTKIWINWVPLLSAASAYSLILGRLVAKDGTKQVSTAGKAPEIADAARTAEWRCSTA